MVSFGPTLEGVHSPDEKIYIDTVERFWDYLLADPQEREVTGMGGGSPAEILGRPRRPKTRQRLP